MLKKLGLTVAVLLLTAATAQSGEYNSFAVTRNSDGNVKAGYQDADTLRGAVHGAIHQCRLAGGNSCKTLVSWAHGCKYLAKNIGSPPQIWALGETDAIAVERCEIISHQSCQGNYIGGCTDN